jgi:hypothetical protein
MKDKFLQLTLDSGSTRVLNCILIAARILESSQPNGLLFQHRFLNQAVLIKDREPANYDNRPSQHSEAQEQKSKNPIGLKMYFPFETSNIYRGGQSIFFQPDTFQKTLIDTFGNIEGMETADYARDYKILSALHALPTLDPFLIRDKLSSESLEVDSRYLMISPEEWKKVQQYIRMKIRPMVALALPDGLTNAEDHVNTMVDAFWTANDVEVLVPLITAFRLPAHQTREIIYAWKGIAYFEYQYNSLQSKVIEFARWIGAFSVNNIPAGKSEHDELVALRDQVKQKTKDHLSTCMRILGEYNESYEKLFKRKESATPFTNFLTVSPQNFMILGESIMRLLHVTETWERRSHDNKLSFQDSGSLRLFLTALEDLL